MRHRGERRNARMKLQAHQQTDAIAGFPIGTGWGYIAHTRDAPFIFGLLPSGVTVGIKKRFEFSLRACDLEVSFIKRRATAGRLALARLPLLIYMYEPIRRRSDVT
jgi:hypothetical protein